MRIALPPCLLPPADDGCWAPPLDVQDVVVRLEAAGITDRVARNHYGRQDIWDLAALFFATPPLQAVKPAGRSTSLWREYVEGVSFALPLLLCVLAMACLGYSLWGGNVSANMAAAAGLGTVSSFISTGGFVQVIARRSLFYLGMSDGATAAAIVRRWVTTASVTLVSLGVLLALLARLYHWLPAPYELVALAFHTGLGLLWIAAGILQMLGRNIWTAVATAAGILVVAGIYEAGALPLIPAQVCGILVALLLAFGACFRVLRRRKNGTGRVRAVALAEDIYHGWPYFLYGGLYYALVFADRLLSWTVPGPGATAPIQFRGDYETGLDIALASFVIQVGFVPMFTGRFLRQMAALQEKLPVQGRTDFLCAMNRQYFRMGVQLVAIAAVVTAGLCAGARQTRYWDIAWVGHTVLVAAFGNSILVLALWNANLLFRLSKPLDVVSSISVALIADLAVGYLASRWGLYPHAIFGFLTGAVVFLLLTFAKILERGRGLDYYYYAADS